MLQIAMNSMFGKMLERATNYEVIDVADIRFHEDGTERRCSTARKSSSDQGGRAYAGENTKQIYQ